MKKVIFILFAIFFTNISSSQITNYKILDENTQKTVLLDDFFNLFYSLKNYKVEKIFFLKNGILLWDKNNSKFILLDYDSKTTIDEYTITKKKGYKRRSYNYYNPFFFNAETRPSIIGENKVFIGIVKTKKRLGHKGFQILNIKINNNKIDIELIPFEPEKLFKSFDLKNSNFPDKRYTLETGLASLQLINIFPYDKKGTFLYQFFGLPYVNANKKERHSDNTVFNPVLYLKKHNSIGQIVFNKHNYYKSNFNLYQLFNIDDDIFIYKNRDKTFFNTSDSSEYTIINNLNYDSSRYFKKLTLIEDRKNQEKYIINTYSTNKKGVNYEYVFFKIKSIDKNEKIIKTKLKLFISSKRKIDILAIYDRKIFVKRENPIIPNEIGIYTINFPENKNKAYNYVLTEKKMNQNDIKSSQRLNIDNTLFNEYRLIQIDSFKIFDSVPDSIPADLQICQKSIKCLLKTVSILLKNKSYKYVFKNLMVYDDDDIELLRKNKEIFKDKSNLIFLNELYAKAYIDYDKALWIQDDFGIIEGEYPDFIIFVVKLNNKYYLSVKMIK